VATSATASRRLGDDLTGAWTGTIAMMRHQLSAYETPLPERTVIVVDEASMVSTRDLAWLVQQADLSDGKIVLVGDPKQLPSIDSGGLFHRIVVDAHGVVTDLAGVNQRQTIDIDRYALQQLRDGEIERAVHEYAGTGRIHLGNDEYATKTAMVDAWWTDAQTHGVDRVRMLASRRDEVAMLNQLARVHMTQQGLLHGPVLVNRWGTEFQSGDRIVVQDNWYAHSDLRNGQTGTITTIQPNSRSLVFRRDVDAPEVVLPWSYVDSSVDHAYAQTIHTAQGQTYETTHLYMDTGVSSEHGYTGLSRARGETHLWVNTSRTINGACLQPHGVPAVESSLESLIRQFTRTVVEPPATDQGLAVASATDSQLHQKLRELKTTIRNSPLGERIDLADLTRIEVSITEAEEVARRTGTTGAQRQLHLLEEQRQQLLDRVTQREVWIQDHADHLHTYTAINDELQARTTALAISYQLDPPTEVVETLGPRPTDPSYAAKWDAAVIHHAEARIRLGPDIDLSDSAVLEAARWRDAINEYHRLPQLEHRPVLRLAG